MTDTTSTADHPADPGPPPLPPRMPSRSDRFFAWVSGLGVARADGWLGGVCAGIAARLRIDPIIVRGIVVVCALFGLPMLVLYAIAWALLPDIAGRIHLREAFHGRFDPALIGIGIIFVVGLLPTAPWFLTAVLPFGHLLPTIDPWSPLGFMGTLLALAAIGGLVVIIARSSSRASAPRSATAPDPRMASADHAAPGTAAEASPDSGDGDASADSPALAPPRPLEPAPAHANASEAEIAQWRATHDAWRVQSDAWRRQQQDAERAAREQARREREAAGAAFAAQADERRRVRRATRPRTSFVFVLAALGVATVAGAIASLVALGTTAGAPLAATAVGLLTAAFVVAIAMVVAGLARRRSGFLTFVVLVLLTTGLLTSAGSGGPGLGDVSLGTSTAPQKTVQLFGASYVSVSPLSAEDAVAGDITLRKGTGNTYIDVYPGATLELDASLFGGGVDFITIDQSTNEVIAGDVLYPHDSDGGARWTWRSPDAEPTGDVTADATTTQHIRIDQTGPGSVHVTIFVP